MTWFNAAELVLVAVLGIYFRRKLTAAETGRTKAETGRTVAETAHEAAETESIVVTTVRAALAEVRQSNADKDTQISELKDEQLRMRTQHGVDMRDVHASVDRLKAMVHAAQVSLAAHGQWDLMVMAEVRKTTPDFPEPPSLERLIDLDADDE